MTITLEMIIAAGVKKEAAALWHAPLDQACEELKITTPRQMAAFLAQCAHESAGFTRLEENLNYSAEGLAAVWPRRFAVLGPDKQPVKMSGVNQPNKFALALHRKPELIANVVYGGRMGNGPIESGDGWRYRGRGLKQLTGKDNYVQCGNALGIDLTVNPEFLLRPRIASWSAAWYWKSSGCGPLAEAGDFVGVTRRINGGTIGLADRQARYERALSVCLA